jgi:hypothetical protein
MVHEMVAVAERVVLENKPNADYLWQLGNARCGLGMFRRENSNKPGWEESIRSGLIQFKKAAEIDTKRADSLDQLGVWHKYLGEQLAADGHEDESLTEYRLALKAYQAAARRKPGDVDAKTGIDQLAKLGIK